MDATSRPAAAPRTTPPGAAFLLHVPHPRMRSAIPIDVVTFVSACPTCGEESAWTEEREDTRMRLTIHCPTCSPDVPDQADLVSVAADPGA